MQPCLLKLRQAQLPLQKIHEKGISKFDLLIFYQFIYSLFVVWEWSNFLQISTYFTALRVLLPTYTGLKMETRSETHTP